MVSYRQFSIGKSYCVSVYKDKKMKALEHGAKNLISKKKNETRKINVSGSIHIHEGETCRRYRQ